MLAAAAAGLDVATDPFRVPGPGRSRNVIGALDTPRDCRVRALLRRLVG